MEVVVGEAEVDGRGHGADGGRRSLVGEAEVDGRAPMAWTEVVVGEAEVDGRLRVEEDGLGLERDELTSMDEAVATSA